MGSTTCWIAGPPTSFLSMCHRSPANRRRWRTPYSHTVETRTVRATVNVAIPTLDGEGSRPRNMVSAEQERDAADFSDTVSTKAEVGLYSDAGVIEKQSREVSCDVDEDLLEDSDARSQE